MLILSLAGALLIGVTLGLMGSGGSILTLPLLVYLLGRPGDTAVAESLAIVGGIAAFGVIPHARKRLVEWRTALLFGLPGMAGAFAGAVIGAWMDNVIQLVLFAGVMLTASAFMFRRAKPASEGTADMRPAALLVALQGAFVGVLTGIVGVGGGFLIVPALVLLGRLPIHRAVATSLVVIAANSAVAFTRYAITLAGHDQHPDWRLIALFIAVGAAGTFVGKAVGGRISQATLRRAFAVFLVVMALVILAREGSKLLAAPSSEAASTSAP